MKNNLFALLFLTLSLTFNIAHADIFRGGVSVGGGLLPTPCDELSVKLAESVKQNTGREVNVSDLRFNLIVVASAHQHLMHISKYKAYSSELNNILSKNLPELLTGNTLSACHDPRLIQIGELTKFDLARIRSSLEFLILNLN